MKFPPASSDRRKSMTSTKMRFLRIALAATVGIWCLFVSDRISSSNSGFLMTQANARIGRPLTPMSYAGVARRTTGRAVYGAAAVGVGVGVAVGAAAAVAPRCVQVVDAYGRIVTRCN
jgi:hypothetical protein